MNFYTYYNLKEKQLISKYIQDLEYSINSIINFVDTFNPNYILLNTPNKEGTRYFSDQELAAANIFQTNTVYPNNMRPHYVLNNSYGGDINIANSTITVPQGFAVRHDGYTSEGETVYSVISLASSGTYYIVDSFTISAINTSSVTCQITWQLQDNATDNFGTRYLLSLTVPGARFYYHPTELTPHGWACYKFTQSPLIMASFSTNPANPLIATSTSGLWTSSYLLSHENYKYTDVGSKTIFEETIKRRVKYWYRN